jgi:hypothetical protein
MSLDVYVMPLWRFKAGYFESPLERHLGLKPKVINLSTASYSWQWLSARQARRDVRLLQTAVQEQVGALVRWRDEGTVVYAERPGGFEALRAYAKWIDYRQKMPRFDPPDDGDYYKHPVWLLPDNREDSCFHLVNHDCYSGYFLPCKFRGVARVEPFEVFGRAFQRSVASSFEVQEELQSVNSYLELDVENWKKDAESHRHVSGSGGRSQPADPLYFVKAGFTALNAAVDASLKHELPVIFHG